MIMADTQAKSRDTWDKLDIILRFVGAVGTAVVVGCVGFFGSHFLARREDAETDLRLYTELMSKREEADTLLRKEMFNSIITNFLKPASLEQPDQAVLNLELLAHNFHDSLDLGPLFKDVYKNLAEHREKNAEYIDRLEKVTQEVTAKQVAMLEEAGGKRDMSIAFADLTPDSGGVTVMDDVMEAKSGEAGGATTKQQVMIQVLGVDRARKELKVRLLVKTLPGSDETYAAFTVGFFDFPMLDNVRLPQGHRCAIVLNQFEDASADFTFVYFPGSRASLKEKPYYDEILYNLRRQPQP
jgi:hypothetical protein